MPLTKKQQIDYLVAMGNAHGLVIPSEPVCLGHTAPAEFLRKWVYDRPLAYGVHGPRGGGKSALRAFATYLLSIFYDNLHTRILGGSEAQSRQVYGALELFHNARPDLGVIASLMKQRCEFVTRSTVEILAASPKQVHGPHIQQLIMDEVEEIESKIREAALGMAMEKFGISPSVSYTSTWHKIDGPMSELRKKVPFDTFCAFEVLQRCPEARSGPNLEGCEECKIKQWCHSDRHLDPLNRPKAKRSNGHYSIDSLILQASNMSPRGFESYMLCGEPRAESMWYTNFDEKVHVTDKAEYDRNREVFVSIDPNVCTAAVWFQLQKWDTNARVNVFGDYYQEGLSAEQNGLNIIRRTQELCGIGIGYCKVSIDSAASQRSSIGPKLRAEYGRAGCVGRGSELHAWPHIGQGNPKADVLNLIDSLLLAADGTVNLTIHPRCERLITAFKMYERKKSSGGQPLDEPLDYQHPHEDLIDALSGGVSLEMPEGRKVKPRVTPVPASQVM